MKRRYKLLLIVTIGVIITLIINSITTEYKFSLVSLGDGVSLGMTGYDVVGTSYNDYVKEHIENRNYLKNYNNEYSIQHLTIEELYNHLEKNRTGSKSKTPFKQVLAHADLITINIGMDEFIDLAIKNKIDEKHIKEYLYYYEKFITNIRSFYENDIIIISLYPAYNFDKNTVYELNQSLATIAGNNNADFLDITALSLNQDYYANKVSYYMNYKAHQIISKELINMYKL